MTNDRALRIGFSGSTGAGKTTLIAAIAETLRDDYTVAIVVPAGGAGTLARNRLLPGDRIELFPVSADLEGTLAALEARIDGLEVILVEFDTDLVPDPFAGQPVDRSVFVIDPTWAGPLARQEGVGVARADLLVINKVDRARLMSVSLPRMLKDARIRRTRRPIEQVSATDGTGMGRVIAWIEDAIEVVTGNADRVGS